MPHSQAELASNRLRNDGDDRRAVVAVERDLVVRVARKDLAHDAVDAVASTPGALSVAVDSATAEALTIATTVCRVRRPSAALLPRVTTATSTATRQRDLDLVVHLARTHRRHRTDPLVARAGLQVQHVQRRERHVELHAGFVEQAHEALVHGIEFGVALDEFRPRSVSRVPPPPRPPVARSTSGSPDSVFIVSIASQAPL